ncbi:MAG: ActS/PrrB/RegB family redox-sensitive histidine kinase [Alphaproteobacteria bacterium]|nr:ActS/PrrB/RegB family redox-sensitive histidine kinase [Alphaproteobacteria bacterium]MBU1514673.1 ActS/PrrB/RegB family redox-sensitive histidine kinase [Alphaproteobacteria bacterium]MBU2093532.1 ActS/PrrB/RegB family redox-sensitive histidine kinase [Alphaproteobacteria bacterium]MBU2149446.1 ActS/PrrB/RegB family redox-sensitive histidine kinase [Alphaproteobacteria bacterium]MBU2305511.1 ActS/PrrB/RegB family redox-sensitive histidine kinase [Alphaproteobacteria bacterium]
MSDPPPHGLDTAPPSGAQDVWDTAAIRRGHLRVRTLVTLRWMLLGGEMALLGAMKLLLGYPAPYFLCAVVVAAGAFVNVLTGVASQRQRVMGDNEAMAQLSLDILQMALLLGLIGGTANPFILILLAPVTLAAATLPLRPLLALAILASALSMLLTVVSLPYPSLHPEPRLSLEFRLAAGIANVAGIALVAGYVRQSVVEAARMALALDVTQTVLAREQKLSALGALAAAAAHELGTPLATIAIVAKEMSREATTPQVKEDAELLIAQADRCREILKRLAATPDQATDEVHERLSLRQLVQEVIQPHANASKEVRVEAIVTGAKDVKTPDIRRLPEITHAFTTFVENAVDFAKSEILVSARFDADSVSIEVRDDGPGFSPEILAKLGEPYVTSRPGAEGSRTGHIGMGLGFFISKTLLERTGAEVTFHNAKPRGAVVAARWPRSLVEVV